MKKILTLLISFILCFTQISWGQAKVVDTSKTYTYTEMERDLFELQEMYPDLIKVSVIGQSEYGRNIYEAKLGTGDAILHINGSHHAREWISTTLTMKMLEDLAIGYKNNEKWSVYNIREILNKTTISFVPMVNPDGVTLQQSGLTEFPKSVHQSIIAMNNGSTNFKRWKANAKGIDLNRQYNANWYSYSTPTKPSYAGFKGYKPEEAKEVISLLNLVRNDNPEMVLSYHSSGELIFWKYGQDAARLQRDQVYANKLASFTGYDLVNSGYGINDGKGFKDWFVQTTKKPGFTLELSPYVGETNVPLSNFSTIWNQNKYVPLYLAQESYNLYFKRVGDIETSFKELKDVNSDYRMIMDITENGSEIKEPSSVKAKLVGPNGQVIQLTRKFKASTYEWQFAIEKDKIPATGTYTMYVEYKGISKKVTTLNLQKPPIDWNYSFKDLKDMNVDYRMYVDLIENGLGIKDPSQVNAKLVGPNGEIIPLIRKFKASTYEWQFAIEKAKLPTNGTYAMYINYKGIEKKITELSLEKEQVNWSYKFKALQNTTVDYRMFVDLLEGSSGIKDPSYVSARLVGPNGEEIQLTRKFKASTYEWQFAIEKAKLPTSGSYKLYIKYKEIEKEVSNFILNK